MKKLLTLIVAVVIATIVPGTQIASANTNNTPILWVHGLQVSGACPAVDSVKQAAPFKAVATKLGYKGQIVPIDYYCGDKTGVSIRGAGGPSTEQYPQNGYTPDTPIERLSLDLAWFIYNTYTSQGKPVSIASASMGGLIAMHAVTHAGQVDFPPVLLVENVVTFSTPFGGVDKPPVNTPEGYVKMICGVKIQCTQMLPGSAFLTDLAAQTIPANTDVTTIGGGQRDILTYKSTSAIAARHKVNFYNIYPITYDHVGYLTDQNMLLNMSAEVAENGAAPVRITKGLPHSLNWAYKALTTTAW